MHDKEENVEQADDMKRPIVRYRPEEKPIVAPYMPQDPSAASSIWRRTSLLSARNQRRRRQQIRDGAEVRQVRQTGPELAITHVIDRLAQPNKQEA